MYCCRSPTRLFLAERDSYTLGTCCTRTALGAHGYHESCLELVGVVVGVTDGQSAWRNSALCSVWYGTMMVRGLRRRTT